MGLDDMLKDQISSRMPELKEKLVSEFDELTHDDLEGADDPDEVVDRVAKKTGQPREQVEQRVKAHAGS
jgi:predicted house-cleaning noncanonical NTP pyrophosphatase (MazG superfamily)